MNNVTIEILMKNDINEYSELINEVMEEFNKIEVDGFQKWFASVEGITFRREAGFNDGSWDTVQFAAKHQGNIVGVLEVENKEHIQSFFVKKEFQNKGIGKMLLEYSLEFFKEKEIEVFEYEVLSSDYAINIYKSWGFKGEGKYLRLPVKRPKEDSLPLFRFRSSKWVNKLGDNIPWSIYDAAA